MALSAVRLTGLGKLFRQPFPFRAARYASTFKHEGIQVYLTQTPKPHPDPSSLVFGKNFSDHMLVADWSVGDGWETPKIIPYSNFSMSPASSCLHYSTECFEGMKAYHCVDGKIRMFRPMENVKRLSDSAAACSLPEFDKEGFLECIKDLVRVDRDWVPRHSGCSLYIRPTFIGTQRVLHCQALLYSRSRWPVLRIRDLQPCLSYADPAFIRSWPGGVGAYKMGGNYGPAIRLQKVAASKGCDQVLWLLGDDHNLTEVGTMNIFVHWINEQGDPEIATPPLDGTILPGVTRKSLLELGPTWGTHNVVERTVSMEQIKRAVKEERLKEVFGAGTACVVCPVSRIRYLDEDILIPTMDSGAEVAKRYYQELLDIQYGRVEHEWSVPID